MPRFSYDDKAKDVKVRQLRLKSKKRFHGLIFVVAMWLLSRMVIVVAMQLIAPSLHLSPASYNPQPIDFVSGYVPQMGWELFSHWDGAWYRKIATSGYDYANDGQWHSIAFFPLFPLVTRGVMTLGLPFEVAGTLVNNLAFLGALFMLYRWTKQHHGINAARWATAVLAWCPLSLYGTVLYTEGLFLLLTTAALRAFDNRQYAQAALWGAMATTARATGVALIPTFLLVAWRERRPLIAYATGLSTGGGLVVFIVYCAIRFKDPLAFVHVQQAWRHHDWLSIFNNALTLDIESVIKIVMLIGGSYLLWHLRTKLNFIVLAYSVFTFALLLMTGATSSFHRYAYATVSLSIGLGVLLEKYPRWGYALISFFAILLIDYAIRFAWWQWVA
ncbi:MAG TPA: mannosyltransferase family protein [Coleofasciculaceae cyanobacterium]|jgi:Gpi18-like mannosyltransferase